MSAGPDAHPDDAPRALNVPAGDAGWSGEARALWARIAAHRFENDRQALDFMHRLAREKAWTLAFARGAVAEYRRFAFLCAAAVTPMTPSEEVDEVWHLHLLYTRDYWDVWCGEVLRARLHHDPTEGGAVEQRRFGAQYAETLIRYEQYFGPSPEAYWPAAHHRFGSVSRFRAVDTQRAFIVPRIWRRRG